MNALSTAPMRKVRIFVLARNEQRVIRALGDLGVMHLRSSVEESGGELQPEQVEGEMERARDLLRRIEDLLDRFGVEKPEASPVSELPELDAVEDLVSLLEERSREQREELEELEEGLEETRELAERLGPFRNVRSSLRRLRESGLLALQCGRIPPENLGAVREDLPPGALFVRLGAEEGRSWDGDILVLSGRRRRFAVETVLEENGFEERELPVWGDQTPADVYEQAGEKQRKLTDRIATLRRALEAFGRAHGEDLRRAWGAVRLQLRFLQARRNFGTTWATTIISGWVPAEQTAELRETLNEVTNDRAVIEVFQPTEEEIEAGDVPSRTARSTLLRPFQRLVQGYGVPDYREIEPTVMFAVSFLLMFGLIFGDLGHGLCLIAVGLLLKRWGKGDVVRDIGRVMTFSGIASSLFGTFFQGSFFGASLRELGFPFTLSFEPMRFEGGDAGGHVVRYLILAVALGIVLISVGAVLNIVNRLRRGDLEEGLLGRFGVVGIILYWGALGWVIKLAVAGAGPSDLWLIGLFIVAPLIILVFHEPLYALFAHRDRLWREGLLMGFFQGLIEAVEAMMTYMANTFSFLRVAAFALSHAALCFTIFVLERLVHQLPGGPLWSVVVFALGTAVVIALEGLIVAIQIMRLEYYEFFSKFFHGEGTRYDPFRLDLDESSES